jgi:hypothetical protein
MRLKPTAIWGMSVKLGLINPSVTSLEPEAGYERGAWS